jgi:serine/threonine protein phosphatase 1
MNNVLPQHIQKLPANKLGKDYVIGDLHGCFTLLERLLAEVEFDKANDRLFSVGDLADRGPESLRCLELLAEPWFFAVQGNHEGMLTDFFQSYLKSGKLPSLDDINESDLNQNGGGWIKAYILPEENVMTDSFNRALFRVLALPLIRVVGEGENRFHVVHAELVKPDFKVGDQLVSLDSDLDQWLQDEAVRQSFMPGCYGADC